MWHPKAVGYAIFYEIAHLIGWDATSILLVGRIQTALLACATVAMVYACARALGEDRNRALIIVLILLCFSNFMERIFRTIAEPLAVFFAVAALLVVLRARELKGWQLVAAGVLSGLAFLATQKSIYFNLALGLGLVADAALMRRYTAGVVRGAWLVSGWTIPIIAYCFIFGGADPIPIARNLIFGPIEIAGRGGGDYGGLRRYVLQTLARNYVLYVLCFAGMALSLTQIMKLDERRRIALIFSVVITVLVFAHDQPWPYVFIMALPFMSLWSLTMLDGLATRVLYLRIAWAALAAAIAMSFVVNLLYLRIDNAAQLELVARAESLLASDERYFDGIGMLPNRMEPTTLWLDKHYVLKTLRESGRSEAYSVLSKSPPKLILWSYRMDYIYPVVAPLILNGYVRIAPNLRIAGVRLQPGERKIFDVPIAGSYALYNKDGTQLSGQVDVDGKVLAPPLQLSPGPKTVTLHDPAGEALLLPTGFYAGRFKPGSDNDLLFEGVYD
nr:MULTISPECIES: glycosyltransferase family 39 protein [unclassified Mesorhizobium]